MKVFEIEARVWLTIQATDEEQAAELAREQLDSHTDDSEIESVIAIDEEPEEAA